MKTLQITITAYAIISLMLIGYNFHKFEHLTIFKRIIQTLVSTIALPLFIGAAITGGVYRIWCIAQLKAYFQHTMTQVVRENALSSITDMVNLIKKLIQLHLKS